MRSFGFRLLGLAAVVWAGIGSSVWALGFHSGETVEAVYVMPTTTTLALPTSYVVSGSWVEPTALVIPSYYTTTSWTDPAVLVRPSYVSTSWVRTGLFGRRRLVERSAVTSYGTTYLPTSYYLASTYRTRTYLPTVWETPGVWESAYVAPLDCVCPGTVVAAVALPRATAPGGTVPRSSAGSRNVQSQPADDSAISSDVGTASGGPVTGTGAASPGVTDRIPPYPQDLPPAREPTPPVPPASASGGTTNPQPAGQAAPAQAGQAGPGGAAQRSSTAGAGGTGAGPPAANPGAAGAPLAPPTAPSGVAPDRDTFPPATERPGGEVLREVQRPNYSRPVRPAVRNVLFGTVQSSADNQPEEGVRVTVTGPSDQKLALTDAFGRFAVRLAEGDWTVNVTMPSGRVYPVSRIHVGNGQIIDAQGNRIPSLEITR